MALKITSDQNGRKLETGAEEGDLGFQFSTSLASFFYQLLFLPFISLKFLKFFYITVLALIVAFSRIFY